MNDLDVIAFVKKEFGGRVWHRKDRQGTAMSFSLTLMEMAGGIRGLITEWEPEPATCGPGCKNPKGRCW